MQTSSRLRRRSSIGVAVIVGAVLSRWIKIPFSNPEQIVGPLTVVSFHPANNILRFLFFIGLPALVWLAFEIRRPSPVALTPGALMPPLESSMVGRNPTRVLWLTLALILLWSITEAIRPWGDSFAVTPIDLFHEGEFLTPAWNWMSKHRIWTGSYFIHGAFYDGFAAISGWKIFDVVSIGACRAFYFILRNLIPLGVGVFFASIAWGLRRLVDSVKTTIILGALFFAYILPQGLFHYLDLRDLSCLAGFSLMVFAIVYRRKILWCAMGALSVTSLLLTIDRGTYLIVTSLAVLILPFFLKDRQAPIHRAHLLSWFIGTLAAGVGWAAVLGPEETRAFGENFFHWARYKDFLDSYIFPPLYPRNLQHTLPCLMILFQLLGFLVHFKFYRRNQLVKLASLHGLFLASSVIYFRSALGRSDTGHVQYASTFAFWGFGYLLGLFAIRLSPDRQLSLQKAIPWLLLLYIGKTSIWPTLRNLPAIAGGPQRMVQMTRLPDNAYIANELREPLGRMKSLFEGQSCTFLYPSEPALHYLLRKPSCGRFFLTWFATPIRYQKEVIDDLEREKPPRILFDSPAGAHGFDGIENAARYPLLDAYLKKQYRHLESISGWVIYERTPQ